MVSGMVFGIVLGFFICLSLVGGMNVRVITEGSDEQPDTIRFKGITYVLVRAKIEEAK